MNQACPVCNTALYSVIYTQTSGYPDAKIVKCNSCSHIYTLLEANINTQELYTDQDEVYKVVENRGSIFDKILTLEYRSVIKKINFLSSPRGTLMDFGCGKGKFGSLAKRDGWSVKCVETSEDRAEYARKTYQLEVNSNFYLSGKIFNLEFDVITLFHVLEHLPKPGVMLDQLLKDNLNNAGLAVIEVPNFNSLQSRIAKNRWIHLDVPRHINHFTPRNLEQLLIGCEMIPIRKAYFSYHLGLLGMVDSLLKLSGYKKNIIYELKNRKSILLILRILFILPLALLLEALSSFSAQGGIIRIYCTKKRLSL